MSGKVARKLRRKVYGTEFSPRERTLLATRKVKGKYGPVDQKRSRAQAVSDPRRYTYQRLKEAYLRGEVA